MDGIHDHQLGRRQTLGQSSSDLVVRAISYDVVLVNVDREALGAHDPVREIDAEIRVDVAATDEHPTGMCV